MLIRQLSQYNLTKLFRMKLKTTKHTKAFIWKKCNGLFGQPKNSPSKVFIPWCGPTALRPSWTLQHVTQTTQCPKTQNLNHITKMLLSLRVSSERYGYRSPNTMHINLGSKPQASASFCTLPAPILVFAPSPSTVRCTHLPAPQCRPGLIMPGSGVCPKRKIQEAS